MANASEPGPGPLAGVRVLDLATDRAELAGRILADLGADVLKAELPGGAKARTLAPFDAAGASLYWAAVGIGKRSVVIDYTTAAGRDAVRALAAEADLFIESDGPGVMTAYGLGDATLRAANPSLVYVSVTPYGQDGPYAHRPATDLTLEAAGGLLGLQGDGDRPPVPVGYPQASFHGGAQAAADAIIALCERERSGLGQHLDVSMQAAMEWTLMNASGYPPNTGGDPPNHGANRAAPAAELVPGVVMPSIWPCADGWMQMTVTLGGLGARTLGNLVRLIAAEGELSPALADSGWISWTETIAPGEVDPENVATAVEEIRRYFLKRTKEELMARAVEHRMLLAPIRTLDELIREPQLRARQYWRAIGGRLHPGPSARLSRTPMEPSTPAPAPGQHQESPRWKSPAVAPRGNASGKRSRAFEGLRVADFAWVGVGPLIAKALADHGATVVHVESAVRPDVLRLGPPFKDGVAGIDRSQFQANFNSSKVSLALNLAMAEGQEVARRVIAWSDVVLESFVPGVLRDFGFTYESLSKDRPELIMLSTCLNGQTGPYATYRGFGTQGSTLAGLHGLTGWPDRPPKGTWGAYTDFIAPRYGVSALTAAILERERSGLGQYIDLAQVEAAIHFLEPALLDYTVNGVTREAQGHRSERAWPHGVFATEGAERYVAVAVEEQSQWQALVTLLGLKGSPRAWPGPAGADPAIDATLAEWCAVREPWAAADELCAAGVPAAVVARPSDLYSDPQLAHRGFFVTCDHAEMGPTPYDGPATIFSETPARLTAGPALGQHTDMVLREILGMGDDEIAELTVAGVLA